MMPAAVSAPHLPPACSQVVWLAWQMPPWQLWPAGHSRSVRQIEPVVHTPPWQTWPMAQAVAQLPQLSGLDCRSMQLPPHIVWPAPQPPWHRPAMPTLPAMQSESARQTMAEGMQQPPPGAQNPPAPLGS